MKILITGAAGFIGSHITDKMVQTGASVLCVDSLDQQVHTHAPSYLRSDVEYCFSDLRQVVFDKRFSDIEVVIHLAALGGVSRAAREPANVIDGNVRGTIRLVEMARRWAGLKHFILASSFSVYGAGYRFRCPECDTERNATRTVENLRSNRFDVFCERCKSACSILPITEGSNASPLEVYGASKYMQELCLTGFDHCNVTILRFSSVYGNRLRLDDGEATIIAKLAGWIRNGIQPTLFEDGQQMRDWVYVGDIVAAVESIVNGAQTERILNVCSGVGTSLITACSVLSEVFGVQCNPKIEGGYRPGDMRHCIGNTDRMRALLGRAPTPFSLGCRMAFENAGTR